MSTPYIPGRVIQLLIIPILAGILLQHITNGIVFASEYVVHEAKTYPPIVVET